MMAEEILEGAFLTLLLLALAFMVGAAVLALISIPVYAAWWWLNTTIKILQSHANLGDVAAWAIITTITGAATLLLLITAEKKGGSP